MRTWIRYFFDPLVCLLGGLSMKVSEIVKLLNCEICVDCGDLGREVHSACGADMMSDVLAFVKEQSVLLTGLVNPQVVRTAEMMDMRCIVFVRGKQPDENLLGLARESGIIVLKTKERMYQACGILYMNGLRGGEPCSQK